MLSEKGETSYGAYVPDLPGSGLPLRSRREVMKLIGEGIKLHIEALQCAFLSDIQRAKSSRFAPHDDALEQARGRLR